MGSALLSPAQPGAARLCQALLCSIGSAGWSRLEEIGGVLEAVIRSGGPLLALTPSYSLLPPPTSSYTYTAKLSSELLRGPQSPSVRPFVLSCVVLSRADLSLRTPGTENLTCSSCHSRRRVPSDSSPNSWSTNRTSTPSSPILAIQLVGL